MKRLFLSTLAMVAAVVATLAVAAAPVLAASMTPLGASFTGTAGFTDYNAGKGQYDGSGSSTNLGKAKVHGDIQVTGAPGCTGGFSANHSDVMTAANGDKIFLTVTEDACPVTPGSLQFHCVGTYAIIGGTGRYATATGNGVFDGDVDFALGQFQATYRGLISK